MVDLLHLKEWNWKSSLEILKILKIRGIKIQNVNNKHTFVSLAITWLRD